MINEYMTEVHRHCDSHFAKAEQDAADGNLVGASKTFAQFHQQMERHFAMEEKVLFPAFEQATGMTSGPTQVMRMEHIQMRSLFEEMQHSLAEKDTSQYLGLGETLLILMQQHNMKEEQILYPMADRTLAADSEAVLTQMQSL